jgi:integrase
VSLETRRQTISVLNVFLRKTLAWGWDDVPDRPLLSHLDLPKNIERVPRYLPADQLAAIEDGIRALPDPYQRAANLIARWVGPRRSEIRRLELDCLDTYPDGHPRLRIPAGKTYTERSVPLHPEAADALRECVEATRQRKQRPLIDEVTGKPTRGARIAGPAAQALRNNELPQQSLDWLTSNYYKTCRVHPSGGLSKLPIVLTFQVLL